MVLRIRNYKLLNIDKSNTSLQWLYKRTLIYLHYILVIT